MLLIDTNSLVIYLLGILDIKHLGKHKRASIYDENDFLDLAEFIGDPGRLLVLPNVWSEVDNLLNNFSGNEKYPYILAISSLIKESSEKYLETHIASASDMFSDLGVTDSLLLEAAKDCEAIITSDSQLSDYALAFGFKVYDMVKLKNEKLGNY